MAHQVETLEYVSNPQLQRTGVPWHGLGVAHDDWLTDEQAKAALDWAVELRPLYRRTEAGLYVESHDSQEVVKVDPAVHDPFGKFNSVQPTQQIATVGLGYVPYQNDELIELGSLLVDDWGAKWDTVASLRSNRLVFAALRLDVVSEPGRGLAAVEGTDWWSWLLLWNSHDGSSRMGGSWVKIRPVCHNTFTAGISSARAGWSVRHTGDMTAKAEEAHRQIGLATQAEVEFGEFAQRLADVSIGIDEFQKLEEHLFPTQGLAEGSRAIDNAESARTALEANWLRSETIPESIRFTRWGALQGVTEWAEHKRPHRSDKRVATNEHRVLSTLFGGPVQQVRDKATNWLSRDLKPGS